ncbi:cytochrome P-450 cyp509A1 [Spinellus fusiger]|nr:cytochrome P-450 cyp509A1 [Spinellus fusiger]
MVVKGSVILGNARSYEAGSYQRERPQASGWEVCVSHPEAIKTVLLRSDIFPKIDTSFEKRNTLISRFVFGPNLLFLNGHEWKKQRKITNPAFHRAMPVQLFGSLMKKAFKVIEKNSQRIDFSTMSDCLALDAIGLAAFDFDFQSIEYPDNKSVLLFRAVLKSSLDPIWFLIPSIERNFLWMFPKRRADHKRLDELFKIIDNVVEKKYEALRLKKTNPTLKENEKDLLTLLIEATTENDDGLSRKELVVWVLRASGNETTAGAVEFSMYYLAAHPEIQEKARQEVISILGDSPEDAIPTVDQVKAMEYLNMVIKETLRMNGSARNTTTRVASEDTELCGVFIPKGTHVSADIYELQHNPLIWSDPNVYNPERFAPGGEAEKLSKEILCWIPFGGGTRQCIGMNFSLAEQRVMLSMFLRKYTWTLAEGSIHQNGVVTNGFGLIRVSGLDLAFTKRY